jgi:Tol biopolymer transport system component
MRADGSDRVTLTDDRDVDLARDWQPRFTGDGTTLTFYSNLSGKYDAWSIRTDGSGRTKLTDIRKRGVFPMFSPDGTRLVVAVIPNTAAFGAAPFPVTDSTMKLIDGLKFPTGTLTPSYWSRSGRWISGYVIKPTGDAVGFGVLEVATGRARQLNEDSHSYDLAWLPGERQVVYFTDGAKLVIQDVVTLERRDISGTLPHPPDPFGGVVASPDGRTLYYGARQLESNIWLVTRSDGKRG